MDAPTITLIIGIIGCVIGVSTFVSGRMTKAERSGSMETKIDQALAGIEKLSRQLEASSTAQHSLDLLVRAHEEQLKTLFSYNTELHATISANNKTNEILMELLQFFRSHYDQEVKK